MMDQEKIDQKPQPTFSVFYETALLPELEHLEAERKKYKKKVRSTTTPVLLLAGFLVFIGNSTLFPKLETALMVIGVVIGIIGLIVSKYKFNQFITPYTLYFKEKIIRRIIHSIDESLVYNAKAYIEKETFLKSNIFLKKPNRYHGDDLVVGSIGETAIKFSEIKAYFVKKNSDDKTEVYHPIFKGIFFEGGFNKSFKTRTYVLPDDMDKSFSLLEMTFDNNDSCRPPLVKLEDPDFEKHFAVFGEDQIEARYILSTSLMKRLTDFRNKTNKPISISFVDNHVYMAIPNEKNLFEPKLNKSNLDPQFIEDYYNILLLAIGIVDDLNLNLRIWGKLPVA